MNLRFLERSEFFVWFRGLDAQLQDKVSEMAMQLQAAGAPIPLACNAVYFAIVHDGLALPYAGDDNLTIN